MDEGLVQHYIARARDFYDGMQELLSDEALRNSAALLGIHSAISYSDALRIALGDIALASDNHRQAISSLRVLLVGQKYDDSGLRHFEFLISMKTHCAYGKKRIDQNELRNITTKAERFARWASRTGKDLDLGGWIDDNQ